MIRNKHLLILLFLLANVGISFAQKKPNIIIFITDDHSQMDVGCYGNKDVHTPNMDKLASEGMRFNRAYASSSSCTPSRSSMFTGLYPFRNGSQFNHFAVNPGTKSLPHYLRPLGYRVVLAGKSHITPKSSFPFEYISKEMGKYQPIEGRSDKKGETVNFIKEYFANENKDGQPLCLIVATWWPHVPWMPNSDFDPEKLNVPDHLIDTKGTREALAAYYQSITEADNMLGELMEALKTSGEEDNTLLMFFSDQGVQLPGAKWTAYDQGLKVPFIVKWPGKVKKESNSNALISLTDLTPTLIDLAGGDPVEGLDGNSFADVFLGSKKEHRDYVFADASLEPHYWYNYTPARTIITKEGLHYIKNYHPGTRFITHIDAVERNMYYFDTWIKAAEKNEKARFLLNRYSYRPPEELYNLKEDKWEFNNLINDDQKNELNPGVKAQKDDEQHLSALRQLLDKELARQGETEEMILQGQLPVFYAQSYGIGQGISAHTMSFEKELWNPDTLFVTGYIDGLKQDGILFQYFKQFRVIAKNKKLGVIFSDGQSFYSDNLNENEGHLMMDLTRQGGFELKLNGKQVVKGKVQGDHTKINGGYVSVGFARDEELPSDIPVYFEGNIQDLRFTMNKLNGAH